MNNLREELAYVSHEIWSHWVRYQFKCGTYNDDGSFTIPADKVARWSRQIETPYTQLSEAEKESDRHQADKILAVIDYELRTILNSEIESLGQKVEKQNE